MCLPGTIETVREQTEREGVSRRALLAGGGAVALAAAIPGTAEAKRGRKRGRGHGHGHGKGFGRVTDLTHTFRAGFPVYTGDEPTRRTLKNYVPDGFYSQEWTFGEHSGTHMDAPGHFIPGGRRVPQLRPEELLAPAAVIDISRRAASNPDAEVDPRRRGRATSAATAASRAARRLHELGLGRQGQRRRGVQEHRLGTTYHFPGFGIDAVEFAPRPARHPGASASTRSASTRATRPRSPSTTGCSAPTATGIENVANLSGAAPQGRLRVGRRRAVGGGLRRALPRARLRLSRANSGR